MTVRFARLAQATAHYAGHAYTFAAACVLVLVWGVIGPWVGFSDSWQLWANTGTTIVTFLMVFLLQNSQTHDTVAIQAKLDELIRAQDGARNCMIAIEDLTDEQLRRIRQGGSHGMDPRPGQPGL